MSENAKPYGLVAEFENPADTIHAAEKVRDAGFTRWDVYTPYPIHGMDKAMGLKNSLVGWFTFIAGASGFAFGNLMIWFMNSMNYPVLIGGKPFYSPIYAFPVSYECTILAGAFGSLFGMLFLNRLPRLYHPLLKNRRFAKGASHDKFYVVVECADAKYSEGATRQLLESAGSKNLELVEE
jgi:hypothetical protein